MSCSSSYYKNIIVPYVAVMILIYPIGIPLLYFALLYIRKEEVMSRPIVFLRKGKAIDKYKASESERFNSLRRTGDPNSGTNERQRSRDSSESISQNVRRRSRDSSESTPQNVLDAVSHCSRGDFNNNPERGSTMDHVERGELNPFTSQTTSALTTTDRESVSGRNGEGQVDYDNYSDCESDNDFLKSAKLSTETRALSLLYGLYIPPCAFFELFECVRRLSLSGLMVFYLVRISHTIYCVCSLVNIDFKLARFTLPVCNWYHDMCSCPPRLRIISAFFGEAE